MKKLLFTLLLLPTIVYGAVTFPVNGGTGTSTKPTTGQVLLGNAQGLYDLVATSSLGIISGISSLYASSTFSSFGYGSSTYYLATNPSNFLTGLYASSTYIPYTGGTSNVDLGLHNLTADTNSLFVDSVNHRVGMGKINPTSALDVKGIISVEDASTANNATLNFTLPYYGRLNFSVTPQNGKSEVRYVSKGATAGAGQTYFVIASTEAADTGNNLLMGVAAGNAFITNAYNYSTAGALQLGGTAWSGTGAMTISTTGTVGIANSGPGELLTLGTSGVTAGVLSLAGLTSGKAIIVVPSVAGTPTLTLPTTTGTVALLSNITGTNSGTNTGDNSANSSSQPLNTNLTSIGGLANATGALTNNGAGVFSYVATGISNLYASTTFPSLTYASSSYYLSTNPSGFITNTVSNLTNYPSYTYASTTFSSFGYGTSTYYLNTNPSNFITISTLTPYTLLSYGSSTFPSFTYASSSYYLVTNPLSFITGLYASTTFPNFTYATATFAPLTGSTNYLSFTYSSSTFPSFTYGSSTYATAAQAYKEAAKYATTAALPAIVYANGSSGVGATLTGVAVGALGIDGNSPVVGDRILVKNQVSTFQNGVYTVTATGSGVAVFVLTRATDLDQSTEYETGSLVFVTSGTTQSVTTWSYTGIDSPTMGTSPITYVQTTGQGSLTGVYPIIVSGTAISTGFSTSTTNVFTGTNTFNATTTLATTTLNSALLDSVGALGSNGQVLTATGSSTLWTTLVSSGVTNAYASSTFINYTYGTSTFAPLTGSTNYPSFAYGSSTYTGGMSNAYASTTFPSFTYGTSTYYLNTNPSGYITNTVNNLTNYPSFTYATSTYYLNTNPSNYITASALTPYTLLSYGSSTFPTFSYASSSYYLATNPSNFITNSVSNLTNYPTNTYATTTFPTFSYASSTFLTSGVTNLYASTTFASLVYGTSTYYLNTNPSSYITNTASNLTNYGTYTYGSTTFPNFTYASSSYYLATNPSGYITNTVSNLTNYPTYTYGTSTYGTYAYGTSTWVSLFNNQTIAGNKTFIGTTTLATTTISKLTVSNGVVSTSTAIFTVSGSTTTFPTLTSGTNAAFIGESGSPFRASFDTYSSSGTAGSQLQFRRARGTSDIPTAVQANDTLFTLTGIGYGATGYQAVGTSFISSMAEGNFTDSSQPTRLRFFTTATGTVSAIENMTLSGGGNLGLGTTTPVTRLSVVGSQSLSGGFLDSAYATGTVGQYLLSTGTSTLWTTVSSSGVTNAYASSTFMDLVSNQTAAGNKTFTGTTVFPSGQALIAPVLGTPTSGVMTNVTGTASGLTAGNVTTNANLTGPITSSGNVTAIASQTGTGSTFAMSASPTFTGTATTSNFAITGLTAGSIPFIGAGGAVAQNNTNLAWDNTNQRLFIGTSSASTLIGNLNVSISYNANLSFGAGNRTFSSRILASGAGVASPLELNSSRVDFYNSNTLNMTLLGNGFLGLGTTTPMNTLTVATGSIVSSIYDWGTATSTSMTVDWTKAQTQKMQMSTTAYTITFLNGTTSPGATLTLFICNPTAGTGGAVTFNQVYWSAHTVPTQTTTANNCDHWAFKSELGTSTAIITGNQSPNF